MANKQSFYVTNIAPQDGFTNENPWSNVEGSVRHYSKDKAKDFFIVTCTAGEIDAIHGGKLKVPQYYYKLVCDYDSQ